MQDHGASQGNVPAGSRRLPPYGPVSPVTEVLEYYRKHELPQTFDRALLRGLEIAPNNESKVLNTLHWLGFIDEAGRPTTVFRRLQASDNEEFERVLRERLRAAYSEVYDHLDPTKASFDEIYRFFARTYSMSLGNAMARLFVGLCQSAGLPMAETRRSPGTAARKAASLPRSQPQRRPQPAAPPVSRSPQAQPGETKEAAPHEQRELEEDLRRLYLRKLIEGLAPLPADPNIDPEVRRQLAELRERELDRIERLLEVMS